MVTDAHRLLVGAAQGVNQAAQCIGAILIAPLIKKWPTRTVLAGAIFLFGVMTVILLIVDAATGQFQDVQFLPLSHCLGQAER